MRRLGERQVEGLLLQDLPFVLEKDPRELRIKARGTTLAGESNPFHRFRIWQFDDKGHRYQ